MYYQCTAKEDRNGKAEWCGGNYVLLSPLVRLRVSELVFLFFYRPQDPNPH